MDKIKRPTRSRTLSGEHLIESYGGDMWDELVKWLEQENEHYPNLFGRVLEKVKAIEKEYGISYV